MRVRFDRRGIRLAAGVMMSLFATVAASAEEAAPAAAAPAPQITKFGDWAVRCDMVPGADGAASSKVCHAFIEIAAKETNKRVLLVGIGPRPNEDGYFLLAVAPLGLVLPKGIGFKVDEGEGFAVPFFTCIPQGCQTSVPLDDARVKEIRSGKALTVHVMDMQRGEISIPVSLSGVSAALDSLKGS